MILMFAKPPDGAPILEDNATVHTPEFEEREEFTISHQVAQLGTPTGIADDPNFGRTALLYASLSEEEGK
jgi:hypothetical protein